MHHCMVSRRTSRVFYVFLSLMVMANALLIPSQAENAQTGYAQVYEPQTSVPLAATVCWFGDRDAMEVASREVRPSSALVYVDDQLQVTTRDGELIAETLADYLQSTAHAIIPALYVRDAKAADALYDYLQTTGQKDVFAAANDQNAGLIAKLTALPHVRGLVDFTDIHEADGDTLLDIIQTTNKNGAKIALLPPELATYENIRFLQDSLITVWALVPDQLDAMIGAMTRGVNGVAVQDYALAYEALEFFQDDAPSLLRVPRVIGHRGMPSVYAENTLMSMQGAYAAGADVIECDIYQSLDKQLFINHDLSLTRLFDRGDIQDSERLTLKELQQIPFSFKGMNGVPFSNNQPAMKSRFGYIKEESSLRIPALYEYYEALKDEPAKIFVEIKSHNPAIVTSLKALCYDMGVVGQTAVITFNTEILREMKAAWPEMSVGALGTEGINRDGQPGFMDYGAVMRQEGPEKALELLYRVLDPFNATYNPKYTFTYSLAQTGRHRGLTVWPWTYNKPQPFADAYLGGVYGLTTNFAWWASDLVTRVIARDAAIKTGENIPLPDFMTQSKNTLPAEDVTAIILSGTAVQDGRGVNPGESTLIWHARRELVLDGKSYGAYYLYSEPFTVTVTE